MKKNNIIYIKDIIIPGNILNKMFNKDTSNSDIDLTQEINVTNLKGKNKVSIEKNIFKIQIIFIYLIWDLNLRRLISKFNFLSAAI